MPIVKAYGNRKLPGQYLTTEKLWRAGWLPAGWEQADKAWENNQQEHSVCAVWGSLLFHRTNLLVFFVLCIPTPHSSTAPPTVHQL